MDPNAGLAYAQRAIIELVQNEQEQALADAERAVELSPEASAPKIALSYAQQGNFQLEAARATLLQATEQNPDDPLAWARLAELWMMFGYLDRAREAAERAVALAPDLERTQIVLGFANLVEIRTGPAKAAFERAIELDPADPLPRLGLGLAQIRESSLEAGRENLEVAVGLDSNDALLRAYLGKAYFAERRDDARRRSVRDRQGARPARSHAYLYDAILQADPGPAGRGARGHPALDRAQRQPRGLSLAPAARFRPRRARHQPRADLRRPRLPPARHPGSVEVADPRSRQRGRAPLPLGHLRRRAPARDRAGQQPAPGADAPGHQHQPDPAEPERGQPQPRHPGRPGAGRLQRVHAAVRAQSGAAERGRRSWATRTPTAARAWPRRSTTATRSAPAAFGYWTDGWRKNNDINQNVQDVFFQTAITPELNAQLEFRRRHSDFGDLAFNFDPDFFSENLDQKFEQDTYRAGLRYSPLPSSDFLLSFIYSDLKNDVKDSEHEPTSFFRAEGRTKDEGTQTEGQYIYRQELFNMTAGFGYSDVDRNFDLDVDLDGFPFFDESNKQQITRG